MNVSIGPPPAGRVPWGLAGGREAPPATGAGGPTRTPVAADVDRARLEAVRAGRPDLAVVLVAAHPDDETLGASVLLSRLRSIVVVHLTDGAPEDPGLRPPGAPSDRTRYARLRRQEALAALAQIGIGAERILRLDVPDQRASLDLAGLTRRLEPALARIRPDIVVTHPYEGGHPDHDAAAFVTQLAVRLLAASGGPAPTRMEMTSYHGFGGRLTSGDFLPGSPPPGAGEGLVDLVLSPAERDRKRRMLACFASQREVVGRFAMEREPLRLAPAYDFRAPPHPGPLWYEQLGWPLTGARWRALAAEALAALAPPCPSRS